jgi:hypothetical protein
MALHTVSYRIISLLVEGMGKGIREYLLDFLPYITRDESHTLTVVHQMALAMLAL